MNNTWNGFSMITDTFEGMETVVVFPSEGTDIGRLAIKTEYWDAFPEAAEIDLLKKGFHLCYIKNENRWGVDSDLDRKARFIRHITESYGLRQQVVPVGMSCGGLIAIKLAAKYPEIISCLYLDAPVLNYLSCPCGIGDADPLDNGAGINEALNALNLQSISQLIGYRQMPIDKIPLLIENKIPVVMVAGGDDHVVPYHENGMYLQRAYEQTKIDFACYVKPECDHHPHGLSDNSPVVQFILTH